MTTPVAEIPIEDKPVEGTFNPNDYDWPTHVKKALESLKSKVPAIDRVWKYYDGEHPRIWLTDSLRDQFDDELIENMHENYCDIAVDAPIKRLGVTGFTQPDDNSIEVEAASVVWDDNDLKLAQKDIYTEARATGEAFVFAWKDDEKDSGIDATLVDSRQVWWPDSAHRNKPTRVVRIWADEEDGIWRATCYYKYVVVRLVGPKVKSIIEALPQARYFTLDPENPGGPHDFEEVPVIRFALERKRRSVIDQIRTFQDKINKLSANLMVSAEFNANRKLALLTRQPIEDGDLKFRPNRALVLDPGGDEDGGAPTSIWEGSATELSNYSDEIDKYIDKLFTKATLPGHLKISSGKTLPSGAAYEADEGPFVESIGDMQDSFGESWHDFFELTLQADVKPQWRNPQVKSDVDEIGNVKTAVEAKVPLKLALRKYAGWTNDELEELENEPLTASEQLAMAAAQTLANGGTPNDGQQPSGGEDNASTPPVNTGAPKASFPSGPKA
jgi:hypothetical protein